MGFTLRFLLGFLLLLATCSGSNSASTWHRMKLLSEELSTLEPIDVHTNTSQENPKPKTDESNKIVSEINTKEEEAAENNPSATESNDLSKESLETAPKPEDLNIDIKKYISPDFHDKNNVYRLPTSPDVEKYVDNEALAKTTTSNYDFDKKHQIIQNDIKRKLEYIDDKFPKTTSHYEHEQTTPTNDVIQYKNSSFVSNNGNKVHKDVQAETARKLDYGSSSTHTVFDDQQRLSSSETSFDTASRNNETDDPKNKAFRTKTTVDPGHERLNETERHTALLSNKIEHDNTNENRRTKWSSHFTPTIPPYTVTTGQKEEFMFVPYTKENPINISKRGSTKFIDTIATTKPVENKQAKLLDEAAVENQIYPVQVPAPNNVSKEDREETVSPRLTTVPTFVASTYAFSTTNSNPNSITLEDVTRRSGFTTTPDGLLSTTEGKEQESLTTTEQSVSTSLSTVSETDSTVVNATTTPANIGQNTTSVLNTTATPSAIEETTTVVNTTREESTTVGHPTSQETTTMGHPTSQEVATVGNTTSNEGVTVVNTTTEANTPFVTATATPGSVSEESTTIVSTTSEESPTLLDTTTTETITTANEYVSDQTTIKTQNQTNSTTAVPSTNLETTTPASETTPKHTRHIPLTSTEQKNFIDDDDERTTTPRTRGAAPEPSPTHSETTTTDDYTKEEPANNVQTPRHPILHRTEAPLANGAENETGQEEQESFSGGKIAAIVISCIGALCFIILAILWFVMRKRHKRFNYGQRCTPVSLDAYSVDNVSAFNSVRRKGMMRASKRSYGNPAFEEGSVTHLLNFPELMKFGTSSERIAAEYDEIPQISVQTNELPEGCETKNRYANVIPLPESRVFLSAIDGCPNSDYINANYVMGPKSTKNYYIACQAPTQSTVDDFWRMIWEQQSRVVLMLTHLFENGAEKCFDYLPPSEVLDCHRVFGDFKITLKKREVKEKYVISNLQLKNMVSNTWREVTQLWYLGWPERGVPSEESSLVAFLIEARSYYKAAPSENGKAKETPPSPEHNPIVVHCSPGTGRTGTVIACDIAIREFELTRQVDVPKTVYQIRRSRAGAVQTKEQYAFIYRVLTWYANKLTGGVLDSV